MGEVAEMFDVKASLIRHWETYFGVLKPQRNKKGNRLFTAQDVEYLKVIHHMVKERGMTLEGARKALRQQRGIGEATDRDTELLERLQRIRSLLLEVREDLKADDSGAIAVDDTLADESPTESPTESPAESVAAAAAEAPAPRETRRKAVVRIDEATGEEEAAPDAAASRSARTSAPRRPRRKKEEGETDKELFAFYEQSLF